MSTAILHFSIIPLKISKPWFWVCTLSLKVGIWRIEPSKMSDFWWSELNIFMLIFTFTVWTIAMLTYRMKTQIGIFRRGWKFLSLIWNIKTAISNVSTTPLWILEPPLRFVSVKIEQQFQSLFYKLKDVYCFGFLTWHSFLAIISIWV